MATPRPLPLVLALLVVGAGIAAAQDPGQVREPDSGDSGGEFSASTVMLPCTPVAAYWTGQPPSSGMPPGPDLAVVSIKARPKDARVYLDGRLVGRARYLDGKPGYLYLEPGSYRLELRLSGYPTQVFRVEAEAACRFDLKHRLRRGSTDASGAPESSFGQGKPFNRVFSPMRDEEAQMAAEPLGGPDPSLRKDLGSRSGAGAEAENVSGASLRLKVSPETASVSIDGAFVATARELALMERPLATTAGKHEVVVRAPGHIKVSEDIVLEPGEVLDLEFSLSRIESN